MNVEEIPIIYCVHPIDTPFQDWNFTFHDNVDGDMSNFTNAMNGTETTSDIPRLVHLYLENIQQMALQTRMAFLNNKLNVKNISPQFLSKNGNNDFQISSLNYKKNATTGASQNEQLQQRKVISQDKNDFDSGGVQSYDVIATGNMCDISGTFETITSLWPHLKVSQKKHPNPHIVTYHRAWKWAVVDNDKRSVPVNGETQDKQFDNFMVEQKRRVNELNKGCANGGLVYASEPLQDDDRNENSNLFCMRDSSLRKVCWKWQGQTVTPSESDLTTKVLDNQAFLNAYHASNNTNNKNNENIRTNLPQKSIVNNNLTAIQSISTMVDASDSTMNMNRKLICDNEPFVVSNRNEFIQKLGNGCEYKRNGTVLPMNTSNKMVMV